MESWQIAILVLVALLVGSLLPLLVQLYSVLHAVRQVLDRTSKDVEEATRTIHRTADRVDRITAALEKDGKIDRVVEGVTAVSHLAVQLRDTVKVASAVAAVVTPAVGAAMRAWRAHHEGPPGSTAPDPEPGGGSADAPGPPIYEESKESSHPRKEPAQDSEKEVAS